MGRGFPVPAFIDVADFDFRPKQLFYSQRFLAMPFAKSIGFTLDYVALGIIPLCYRGFSSAAAMAISVGDLCGII